jgi:hypothetical protein
MRNLQKQRKAWSLLQLAGRRQYDLLPDSLARGLAAATRRDLACT